MSLCLGCDHPAESHNASTGQCRWYYRLLVGSVFCDCTDYFSEEDTRE